MSDSSLSDRVSRSDELEKLAARCERLVISTAPGFVIARRDLDMDIHTACEKWPRASDGRACISYTPRYTISLDAAVTLVPESVLNWDMTAWVKSATGASASIVAPGPRYYGSEAKTPALALCAAALRARAATAKQTEAPDTRGKATSDS